MHLPVQALPGALPLLQSPSAQAIAAQVFGSRSSWWHPGSAYLVAQLGYTPANKAGDTFTGDIILGTAGLGLKIKEGTNARMGTATLVAGTVTVSTSAVTASSRIFLTGQADGGTPGAPRVSARVAGTSFTITSSSNTDTSTIGWVILEPA